MNTTYILMEYSRPVAAFLDYSDALIEKNSRCTRHPNEPEGARYSIEEIPLFSACVA